MRNKEFEEKIFEEIVIDCNDEYDQNMSWFYYVQDEIEFPFIAYIELRKKELGKIYKKIKVLELSTDDSNFEKNFDIKVNAEFDQYIMEFPLSKLEDIRASESIVEIIELWKYWISK